MKKLIVALLIVFGPMIANAQADFPLTCQHIRDDFWIVIDGQPAFIQTETFDQLYVLLEEYVPLQPDSPLYADIGQQPIVLRFTSADGDGHFPHSTEDFSGLTDRARWRFDSADLQDGAATMGCEIAAWDDDADTEPILLSLVQVDEAETEFAQQVILATTVHEMTHLFGAIDGRHCISHPDYSPIFRLPADPGDACWWYGLTGTWTLEPAGLSWAALNQDCADHDESGLCRALATIITPIE